VNPCSLTRSPPAQRNDRGQRLERFDVFADAGFAEVSHASPRAVMRIGF
jgi:hypothetical protein